MSLLVGTEVRIRIPIFAKPKAKPKFLPLIGSFESQETNNLLMTLLAIKTGTVDMELLRDF